MYHNKRAMRFKNLGEFSPLFLEYSNFQKLSKKAGKFQDELKNSRISNVAGMYMNLDSWASNDHHSDMESRFFIALLLEE